MHLSNGERVSQYWSTGQIGVAVLVKGVALCADMCACVCMCVRYVRVKAPPRVCTENTVRGCVSRG